MPRDTLPGFRYTMDRKENWSAVKVLKSLLLMDSKATDSDFKDYKDEYDFFFFFL